MKTYAKPDIDVAYNKIKKVILSSKTLLHHNASRRMIKTFILSYRDTHKNDLDQYLDKLFNLSTQKLDSILRKKLNLNNL